MQTVVQNPDVWKRKLVRGRINQQLCLLPNLSDRKVQSQSGPEKKKCGLFSRGHGGPSAMGDIPLESEWLDLENEKSTDGGASCLK